MITLSEQSLEKFRLCDASLRGLAWLEDGRDLQLNLRLGNGDLAMLICQWASHVRIDLQFAPDHGGMPLSYDCQFVKKGDRWEMTFGFPPQGRIELFCNDAILADDGDI